MDLRCAGTCRPFTAMSGCHSGAAACRAMSLLKLLGALADFPKLLSHSRLGTTQHSSSEGEPAKVLQEGSVVPAHCPLGGPFQVFKTSGTS